MDTRLIKSLNNKNFFVIALITFIILVCCNLSKAMGGGDYLKELRDSGVIGEKKTVEDPRIASHCNPKTGAISNVYRRGSSLVTPRVIGDMVYFGLDPYSPNSRSQLGYSFMSKCMGWKYDIKAYWSSADVTEERTGFSVSLESPDDKTFIDIKYIDIPVIPPLSTPATQEQLNILQTQTYVEAPFVGEERILAAQQAIKWLLTKGSDNYEISKDYAINFSTEKIGNKEFVRAEADVFSKEENVMKRSVVWALNDRGIRLQSMENVRWMETLICQVVADESDYLSAAAKAHMILETLKFNYD